MATSDQVWKGRGGCSLRKSNAADPELFHAMGAICKMRSACVTASSRVSSGATLASAYAAVPINRHDGIRGTVVATDRVSRRSWLDTALDRIAMAGKFSTVTM